MKKSQANKSKIFVWETKKMENIRISVIIPTYNRKNLLKKCLLSLINQAFSSNDFEVLVCDDGSSDKTENLVLRFQKKSDNLRFLSQNHLGVNNARNLGIRKALGEIICFTDDDCLPKKNWLEEIDRAFKNNPQVLGVEGQTLTQPQKVTPFTSQIVNTKGGGYQTCNIAYKKEILRKVNGLDKTFTTAHCDDVDLALRISKLGQIHFEPKAIVIHPPRRTDFLSDLDRLFRIPDEFLLFLKHPDYFSKKYGKTDLFFQVVFKNSIWIRLFHLKYYSSWLKKNPFLYLKFAWRTSLEIILILVLIPRFWLTYRRIKAELEVS